MLSHLYLNMGIMFGGGPFLSTHTYSKMLLPGPTTSVVELSVVLRYLGAEYVVKVFSQVAVW